MTHTCTKHEPGTAACYTRDHCRCDPCRTAGNRQRKRSRTQVTLVDATPVAAHIRRLQRVGWTPGAISAAAGLSDRHASYLASTARRTHAEVARAILAVGPTPDRGMIDATGTHRRIRALGALGWPMEDVSTRAGLNPRSLYQVARRATVTAATARAVAAVYEELWSTPGPSTITTSRNRTAPPPLAWDDGHGPHGIDNPNATPHPWQRDNTRRWGQTIEEIVELADVGVCLDDICRRVGVTPIAVEQALIRADRWDLRRHLWPHSLHDQRKRAS